jgi:hypothetical protein
MPPTQSADEEEQSMPKFVFAYRIQEGNPGSPDAMAQWMAWFEELGAAVVDPGNPVSARSSLGNCGSGSALGGYSLITADDLEAAVTLAKGCPALADGGGVEVGELMSM